MELDDAVVVFNEARPRLMGIAYRMLGSHSEAEDLVQEVWLRWQAADRSTVQSPVAYLSTAVTRLAINASQSARARRETYIGPWLPEPVDTSADPYLGAERGEALSFAVLLVLERLSPTERAAYILREAFDYQYDELAAVLQSTQPAVRQLVSRARKRIRAERRTEVSGGEQKKLLTAFVAAARSGDLGELEQLLAKEAISYSDGGGVARASKFPVVGRERVAKYYRAFHTRFWQGVEVELGTMNGQSAVMCKRDGELFAVCTVIASPDGIDEVLWMMNRSKLTAVA
ncbi:RNA polymerase sigma-70 factor [Kribbella kalugense]|uniref:RNA polymerase sigma-70 factor (ECF subfamily) n=1 Tax=Kribbella kalugense TaxID=2512221 RepID=A0A4R7ZUP7_9ACTN|nr:RNA polymerase sigma-70 factor [Kribbella kalugense]TDW21787.1 RNA polymerase sigma-70 factor (ECF subfamily) [Kribbella kalugense]